MSEHKKVVIDFEKLLRGHYEADSLPKDFSPDRIVPDFGFNLLNRRGLLYTPIVDLHYLEEGGKKPIWPDEKSFAVCLTHDVDAVSLHSFDELFRERWSRIRGGTSILRKVRNLAGLGLDWLRHGKEKDLLHCHEMWLNIESDMKAHSTFFFSPGIGSITKLHKMDCRYDLDDPIMFDGQDCIVAEMIKTIDERSWEIGLHPSWYSFNDEDEMKRQKEAVENVLKHDLVSVRQHYLHCDIRVTPNVQQTAGFRYDSTLGFNDNVGFRFGTCYPWQLYDLQGGKEIPIFEIPLIIQDTAMLSYAKGLRLDENTAFQYIMQITEAVEQVGGVLTLLWHTNYIVNPDWWNLYIRVLHYLDNKNAWLGSIREIGEWWKDGKRHVREGVT